MENVLTILVLVILEGLLSFDNALALAAMVHPLPPEQQKKALTYGMVGAFAFRFIALFLITSLLAYPAVKIAGGLYLLWLAVSNLWKDGGEAEAKLLPKSFWKIILLVELTDIVFSMDSILAAAAMSQVLWVIVVGGILGIVMMRFVSSIFVKLIDKFPRLSKAAFILVAIVGTKLVLEGMGYNMDEGTVHYLFWGYMAAALAYGFTKKVK